jgi:hypothetical protein
VKDIYTVKKRLDDAKFIDSRFDSARVVRACFINRFGLKLGTFA